GEWSACVACTYGRLRLWRRDGRAACRHFPRSTCAGTAVRWRANGRMALPRMAWPVECGLLVGDDLRGWIYTANADQPKGRSARAVRACCGRSVRRAGGGPHATNLHRGNGWRAVHPSERAWYLVLGRVVRCDSYDHLGKALVPRRAVSLAGARAR